MPDFLAENNVCGQTILQLVSRGNAILAELLRLKDYIPRIYKLESKQDIQKYGDIVLDFSYFQVSESQEHRIENNDTLRDLDEEFRDNHISIISRFYLAFESIHTYVTDLNHFLDELEDGLFIHQTLETIFANIEGKQLLCEALYLYGLMLLTVDEYFDGIIRERLLVSYYRYNPQRRDSQSHIDEVCKFLRDTGHKTSKKPCNYPEEYFRRIEVKSNYVDIVIGRLRTDDIYSQLAVYPMPKHRSTALANQASMLYVCLFFSSNILHSQTAVMREIVDKYFPDNWVISLYMGFTVNLIESWDAFRAAKMALGNTLEVLNVKSYANSFGSSVQELLKTTTLLLKDTHTSNQLNLLRDCNVTIRWLMLHTIVRVGRAEKNKKSKQLREVVVAESKCEPVQLFKLLLNTAQIELIVRESYKTLLDEKDEQWKELKSESYKSLVELSEVFSGTKPLSRIKKNEDLERWFIEISKQVDSLEHDDSNSARKIVQLIQALQEVQEFHQLESNMQVVQFLTETRKFLDQMIKNMNIKEDFLITLQIIADISYAWELIDSYTPFMQVGIKIEPTIVIKLRAVFLKLASALEIPLLRINQARSEDLVSVSQYYSRELESYVRKVLQIIPETMFEKMATIIEMQTNVLKELPTCIEKDKLKEYAQLEERFKLAELTHSIAVFAQGMRMMKSTLVGVVCLDPKKLLEDGIRKELVKHITKALHVHLVFSPKMKTEELGQKLDTLGQIMNGYKKSFECIQDYINLNGLKIWQEEVTRMINYNVEQECNGFLRNKVHAWDSAYQNRFIPIPVYPPMDASSENFIGRLAREILRLTDPRNFTYLDITSTWYDIKYRKPVVSKEIMAAIVAGIEVAGIVGLDRLYSFMIITLLQKISGSLENRSSKNVAWANIIGSIKSELKNLEEISNPLKFFQNCVNRSTKLWPEFLDSVLIIGQLQLLRKLVAFHLNMISKFNAKNLESSLQAVNKAILLDIRKGNQSPSEKFMSILSPYFDYSGLHDPFNKIYVTPKVTDQYAITIFVFVIAHVQKVFLPQKKANLSKRTQEQLDGTSLAVGVHTILKQVHPDINKEFIKLLCNYITTLSVYSLKSKNDFPPEVISAVSFLEAYTDFSKESYRVMVDYLPVEVLYLHHTLVELSGPDR